MPHRRNVTFRKTARPAEISPLLQQLSFTRSKGQHWGIMFRRSVLEISHADFKIIANAMRVRIPK
jgi:hypothetical protein